MLSPLSSNHTFLSIRIDLCTSLSALSPSGMHPKVGSASLRQGCIPASGSLSSVQYVLSKHLSVKRSGSLLAGYWVSALNVLIHQEEQA